MLLERGGTQPSATERQGLAREEHDSGTSARQGLWVGHRCAHTRTLHPSVHSEVSVRGLRLLQGARRGRGKGKVKVTRLLLSALGLPRAHSAAVERPAPRPTKRVPRPRPRSSLSLMVRGGCRAS